MTDWILAALSLSALGAFLGLIAWRVPQGPLVVIFSAIFIMAAVDFWIELRRRERK